MSLNFLSRNYKKFIFLLSMFFGVLASAQDQKTVSGIVTADGIPLAGASVVVKDTKLGTTTDFDGIFTLSVPTKAKTLVVSYLGYATQEVDITNGEMSIVLVEDQNTLDEVVINVGYGSQKKSVNTGAISKVTAKDLEGTPNNGRIEQALQGKTTGVFIASNAGQPGSSSTIRVRGITSFNGYGGNNVLWVVDGVAISDDIGFLNQSDIESIEVLKDAASLAIYGARSASGVILVTTKKGKQGGIKVGYTGSYGISSPAKVLDLLNATEYAALRNEKSINDGGNPIYTDLSILGKGTDWQKAIFNDNAVKYNHEVNMSGGTENSNFYLSFGSQNQEGIVMSDISNYDKKSIRLNSNHKLNKYISFGQNLGYSHQKSVGLGNTNSEYGGPLSSAINLDPITPLVETDPVVINGPLYSSTYIVRDENGNPYGISPIVGQEMTNPLAYQQTRLGQYSYGDDIVGNAFVEITPIEGLKIKSTLGAKLAYWGYEGFTPMYYLNPSVSNAVNNITRSQNKIFAWNIENIITYTKQIGAHDFTILLGQGAYEDDNPTGLSITHSGIPTNDYEEASFNFDIPASSKTGWAYTTEPHRVSSLFSRINYNYGEKYLFTGIIRRDGSSNFGSNNKYGIFPSFSLGWVVSKESFWKENDYVNQFKLRGGYGVTGNDRIGRFTYLSTIGGGRNYTMGIDELITSGSSPNAPANPDLQWEETRQTNIGFETKFLNSINVTFDWFNKETVGILQNISIPGYVGATGSPTANVADMFNRGVELEVAYKKRFNEVNFGVSGNISSIKNEVTYLGNGIDFISSGAGFQSMGDVTRTEVGESYNYFWGYQTDGIFQNMAEVNAYTNSLGGLIQPNAQPGDFRWVDADGDGAITGDDRVNLGSPLPKYTFGLNLNLDYKGFDLMVSAQGVAGNKIFQGLRRLDILNSNYQTVAMSRWTGEGTSNDYPRLTNVDANGNFGKMSDFYLQKGDYLRFKVVQLGYTLPTSISEKISADKVRFFLTGENMWTLTKYTGYDPEIGGDVSGIDRGFYPQARTFMFGANLQF
ncbi:MAG: TonB-dependent receptor [Flavobacteriaceae bacterium]|nr:TonB-dependent receptor [Flavobacteriaceae bacterium]